MWTSLDEFSSSLLDKILISVSKGSRGLMFWGITPTCLKLLSILGNYEIKPLIAGVVDDRLMPNKSLFGVPIYDSKHLPELDFDTLVITSNEDKEALIEKFAEIDKRIPKLIFAGSANYEFEDAAFYKIVKSCPVKSKAGGYPNMLIHLYQSLMYIASKNIKGDLAEFGVYQGGTTVFIAKVLNYCGHKGTIYGFDTFAGFPQPKNMMDAFDDSKCEFPDFETVERYCSPYNIKLIKGDICDTYIKLKDIPLAFSFFDTDNYSATRKALELCLKQTVQGGILAFDHYYSPNWNQTIGERIAIKQILKNTGLLNFFGTGIFIKI